MLKTVSVVYQRLVLCLGITGIVIGGVHIVIDVISRYVANTPVSGSMESSSMLLTISAAAFFSVTEFDGRHIRSTLVLDRIEPAHQRLLKGIFDLLIALVMMFIGSCVWLDAWTSMEFGDLSDTLLIPIYPIKFACAIAIFTFSGILVANSVRKISTFLRA